MRSLPSPLPHVGLPWPLPALLVWALAWAAFAGLRWIAVPAPWAVPGAAVAGLLLAAPIRGPWRRAIAAAGFPLSAGLTTAAAALPSALWLVALLPLAALYPLRAWRDAPLFPTPADALTGLGPVITPAPRRVLDAGCGLGHGLVALRRVWPQARIEGIEWSRPLAWLARRRCRWAGVTRGDMWGASWAGYEVVYLFQRPESMARALAKAKAELAAGGWLVSLEFAVPGETPWACVQSVGRRAVWVYRIGSPGSKQRSTGRAGGR